MLEFLTRVVPQLTCMPVYKPALWLSNLREMPHYV